MNHLPLCPTEFNNENNKKLSRNDIISRKNKTIKRRREERKSRDYQKKFEIENLVTNMNDDDSDNESVLGNYNPPPHPTVQQKPNTQTHSPTYNPTVASSSHENDSSSTDEPVQQETFRTLEQFDAQNMYNQYVPYYANASDQQSLDGPKDKLLEKLNYMIHLLEEQKEEKTGHVTEELILYSFLGVFVIFIVDSFARVGKYVR
jgi:hypothetical protein